MEDIYQEDTIEKTFNEALREQEENLKHAKQIRNIILFYSYFTMSNNYVV